MMRYSGADLGEVRQFLGVDLPDREEFHPADSNPNVPAMTGERAVAGIIVFDVLR